MGCFTSHVCLGLSVDKDINNSKKMVGIAGFGFVGALWEVRLCGPCVR